MSGVRVYRGKQHNELADIHRRQVMIQTRDRSDKAENELIL